MNTPSGKNDETTVSIIIPAWNVESTLRQVLAPLLRLPEGWEILVVDDGSTDKTIEIARAMGVPVIPSDGHRSDLAARNTGVRATSGDILIFLDADVVTNLHDLNRSIGHLREGNAVCLFGVYDYGRHLPNTVSRYKNFWIRHSTLTASRPLRWLNSSLVVIRRNSFLQVDGFSEKFTCTHGGGDLDFGQRIAEGIGAVAIDETLQVSHLKHFTLRKLWINDQQRAQGWLSHALACKGLISVIGSPSLANVNPNFSWSIVATSLAVLLAALTPLWTPLALFSVLSLLFSLVLNISFIRDAFRKRIPGAIFFVPLLWFDQIACAVGIGIKLISLVLSGGRNAFHALKRKAS